MPSVLPTALGAGSAEGRVVVHTLWVGDTLPEWVPGCLLSYLRSGHEVWWWIYESEERSGDLAELEACGLLKNTALRFCNIGDIVPFKESRQFYYHGMGACGKWHGWAPFSDWVRYEILARFGGWWVDADSVSVQNLEHLQLLRPGRQHGGDETHVADLMVATERHRFDRRRVGAVAVLRPWECTESASVVGACIAPAVNMNNGRTMFSDWAQRMDAENRDVCLVTNSHFGVSRAGLPAMRELADDMRNVLERYAMEVDKLGSKDVREHGRALPHGNIGMLLFQRMVRRLFEMKAPQAMALHWSVFNPVEATQAQRMRQVLAGAETLVGNWVLSVHIFRQVRDEWQAQGLHCPPLTPRLDASSAVSREDAIAAYGAARTPRPRLHQQVLYPVVETQCVLPEGSELKRKPPPEGGWLKRRRAMQVSDQQQRIDAIWDDV